MASHAIRRILTLALSLALAFALLPLVTRATETLAAEVSLNLTEVAVGDSITADWTITGGTLPYAITYSWGFDDLDFSYLGTDISSTDQATGSATLTPPAGVAGYFYLDVLDADGNLFSAFAGPFDITGSPAPLEAAITLDSTSVTPGTPITAEWTLSGGVTPLSTDYTWFTYDAIGVETIGTSGTTALPAGTSEFTPGSGVYGFLELKVDVGNGVFKWFYGDFSIAEALGIVSVTPSTTSTVAGQSITWSVVTTGSASTIYYRFQVLKDDVQVYDTNFYLANGSYTYWPSLGGVYTVIASVRDGVSTASVGPTAAVTVAPPPPTLYLYPGSGYLVMGATLQLQAVLSPVDTGNEGLTWQSSNSSVATVSATGLVTAVSAGIVTITATSPEMVSGTSNLIVKADVPAQSVPLTYNGQVQAPTFAPVAGPSPAGYYSWVQGPPAVYEATNAGSYWAIASINEWTTGALGLPSGVTWDLPYALNMSRNASVPWTIAKLDLATVSIAVVADQPYTGTAVYPTPAVTIPGYTLQPGVDYIYQYQANVLPGTHTLTIVPGASVNTTGSKAVTFNILHAPLTPPAAVTGLVYSGSVQTGVLPGVGYTLTGNTGTDAGAYSATAALSDPAVNTWSDGTTAPRDIAWSIASKPIALTDFSYNASAQTFTGGPLTLLSLAPVGILTGNDFDVAYQNNVQPGTATAVLTGKNNFTGTLNIDFQINPLLVSGIVLSPAAATLTAGQTQQLDALVTPALANNHALTWSSSNPAVATVDGTGLVTAHGVGSAVITASATDGSGITGTANITVDPILVDNVTLTPDTGTLEAGQTLQLYALVGPADATNKALTWTSDDTNVATVSTAGLVTAVAPGSAVITATAGDGGGAFGTASITVNPTHISILLLNPPTATLRATQTITLVPIILPDNATNKVLLWSSSDELVATVDANGLVTAVSVGQATITAAAGDGSGKTAASIITVEPTPVQTVTLSPATAALLPGQNQQLGAAILPLTATNQALLWSSDDETIATVSSVGLVTAVAPGSATITATAQDGSGAFGTSAITVNSIPVTTIEIAPPDAILMPGDTQQLTAAVQPADASNQTLAWSSSDTGVATVNESGLVTAVAPGSATITATAQDGSGIIGTAAITVIPRLAASVTVTPSAASLLPGATRQLTAVILPVNATDKTLTWASSNNTVATVSASGLVTAVSPGSATITATAQDGSGKSGTCAITVNPPVTLPAASITKLDVVSASSLRLTWAKVTGAKGYEVWRSTSSSTGFVLVKKTSMLTYTNTGLQPGTRYFYKVRAYGANVLGPFSTAKAGVPLGKPVIQTIQAVSDTRIKLTWTKGQGAVSHQVLMGTSPSGEYKVVGSTTATSLTITNLKPNTYYYFRIRPYARVYSVNYYGPVSSYRSARTLK